MATRFLKAQNGGIYKDSNGKLVKVAYDLKLPLVVGVQSADNLYDITASDLEGATDIGDYAFYQKKGLRSVELPSTCTSIGSSAFHYCSALTSASTPNVTTISGSAFQYCKSLTSVDMPKVTSFLSRSCFENCTALTSISLPELKTFSGDEFNGCTSLAEVSIPKVTNIGPSTFMNCSALQSITIPNTCMSIDGGAFRSTKLTSISLPEVTSIGAYAFYTCASLTEIYMPKVRSIGGYALRYCYGLTAMTIPSTCISIGAYALQCGTSTNKCTFTFEGTTPPSIQSTTFVAGYINKIIVPQGCGEAYKTATNWTAFADYIEEATA